MDVDKEVGSRPELPSADAQERSLLAILESEMAQRLIVPAPLDAVGCLMAYQPAIPVRP